MKKEDKSTIILQNKLDRARSNLRKTEKEADKYLGGFYENPEKAVENINKFLTKNENDIDKLAEKLKENPAYFGAKKGWLLSKNGWKTFGNMEVEAAAAEAGRGLAPALKNLHHYRKEVQLLKDTLADGSTRHDPPKFPPDMPKAPEGSKEKTLKERADELVKKFSKKGKDDGPDFHGS